MASKQPLPAIEGQEIDESYVGRRVLVIPQHVAHGFVPYDDLSDHPDCWVGKIVGFLDFIGYPSNVVVRGEFRETDVPGAYLRWVADNE